MLVKSPCLNCPDRRVLCHSECDRYLEYRKKLDDISKQLREENLAEGYEAEAIRQSVKRRRK